MLKGATILGDDNIPIQIPKPDEVEFSPSTSTILLCFHAAHHQYGFNVECCVVSARQRL